MSDLYSERRQRESSTSIQRCEMTRDRSDVAGPAGETRNSEVFLSLSRSRIISEK